MNDLIEGELYKVEFIDHNKSGTALRGTFCTGYGLYETKDDRYYAFKWWNTFEDEAMEIEDNENHEYVNLAIDSVLRLTRMIPEESPINQLKTA